MKRTFYFIILICFSQSIIAQSQYELTFDAQKEGNNLKIDYFIQKTSGADFKIGAANFPLQKSNDVDLDWSQIQANPNFTGPFSAAYSPMSYEPPMIYVSKFINYTQLTDFGASGNGFTVTSAKTQIASFLVPMSGQCPEATLNWERNWGSINKFATNGDIVSIKSGAIFTDPILNEFKFFDIPSKPQIYQAGNGVLNACAGKSVTLETSASNFDMQWFKDGVELGGATDSILNAGSSGIYTVQLENCNVFEISDPVEVNIIPLPEKSIITEKNGILYSSVGGNIQWYHNGQPIAGANSEDLIPSNTGIYTVKSFNSCGEIFSDPYNYAPLGVDLAQNGTYLHVFPNPYIGKTNIEVTLSKETELTIEVYDLKGNLVSLVDEGVFDSGKHQLKFSAQELGYAAGTYVLKVRTNEKELIHNLIELK